MDQNTPQTSPEIAQNSFKKLIKKTWVRELFSFVAIVVFIIIPFRMFIAQPYLVDGSSMDPTFKNGEYLIVDEISYRFEEPKRGDVIIFRYPLDPRQFFIKRIIGLPGETIQLSPNGTTVVNAEHPEGIKIEEPYVVFNKTDTLNFTLKDGQYFAMGDNRTASADSRLWGPVPRKNIVGKPFLALFPIDKIRVMPGSLSAFNK